MNVIMIHITGTFRTSTSRLDDWTGGYVSSSILPGSLLICCTKRNNPPV